MFFFFLSYSFLAPKAAPAAIKKLIPPSIGIQGGGQHGGVPAGGGGGAEIRAFVPKTSKKTMI